MKKMVKGVFPRGHTKVRRVKRDGISKGDDFRHSHIGINSVKRRRKNGTAAGNSGNWAARLHGMKLIQGNLRLVLSVIQRFTGRGEDMEDLFQVGVVGLIKAINHFDLSKEVRFSTYCVPMISGELRRYLRDFNQVKGQPFPARFGI